MKEKIHNLRRALLIFHSPLDNTVGIENAARIFQSALHPKSFISLDQADHLLSDEADSFYTGAVLAAWAAKYIEVSPEAETGIELAPEKNLIVARTGAEGYYTEIMANGHPLISDEPKSYGGTDKGASRYDKEQRTWMTFTSEDGLFGTDISAIAIDGDDVWFGTDMGATKYNEKSHDFITYTSTEGLASNVVTCIAIDDREIWFGSSDSGAACMDKAAGKWRVFTKDDGMLHDRVVTIALDGDHVWFGTEAGLCRYDRKTSAWTAYADDSSQFSFLSLQFSEFPTGSRFFAKYIVNLDSPTVSGLLANLLM